MKTNRTTLYAVLALGVIAAIIVGVWLAKSSADRASVLNTNAKGAAADKASQGGIATSVINGSPPKTEDVRAGLQAIFAGLAKGGARRLSSAEQAIDEALKTKDSRTIAQAAHALVYDSPWPRAEVIEALRKLLTNDDPEVRLDGVRFLYLIGDASGRATATEIMSSKSPIVISSPAYSSGSYDLRFSAAEIASKYRDRESQSAVLALYQSTRSRSLLHCLVNVGVENVGQIIKDALGNQPADRLMELYGLAKFETESPYMKSVQKDESLDMRTRLAAAWARTQVSSDQESAKFIRDFVEGQIADLDVDVTMARRAVQYLGTLNDAASISLLERIAKQSGSTELVRVAAANLILNHKGQSSAGTELVIAELTGKPTKLGIDLAVKLAAASTDPRLTQAGRSFDARREGERIWKQQGADRVQWSLWGWADDYVLALPPE